MIEYIIAVALFVAPTIAVPWTNATCIDEPWSFNSQGQSSCLVSAYLGAQCTTDNTYGIYALTDNGPYGFGTDAANNCLCNSVMWNLLSACALCQGKLSGTWAQWVMYCPTNMITVGKYPLPLPTSVNVPSWAYHDFTTAGVFNAVIASQQSGPESSAIAASTGASTLAPTATSTGTGIVTSVPNPPPTQSPSSSNTGAIIGGIVGGVLGIGLIGLIAFVLVRKRKHDEPALKYPEAGYKPQTTTQPNTTTPIIGQITPYQINTSNQPVSTPEYKPYDPSDPSTFPTGPTMPEQYAEPLPYSYRPQGTPGPPSYTNVPQV
ncbi:hypothetical protein RSOLAG1IB_03173 [Rhizoctonia solani AG-1 IB]|uniref:Transmembrane protein n=1 Tax=Thanatephorus cucumeris (strain AG1-IB / isolate 7/3/14) TaxID=1108050 RepID=A0A0B7FNI2_THACB|nr:hypothetical protein RSOLAG1IB_03173 [Rhizoctonia solani AG-1 IB]